ncbi:nuclear transport factor 2 family protein [Saccharopolyspora sp. WRP15-2]|uniref:Nuclear transport factor 2 family protein n=1 Tax=Saccharopolyspora oryzae TaxID=2997343 RepID=A0ABT4UXE5_9PSEU|nr:nuclear transport factor 2 family protein [Saccharopolyspora oryzae]MDA3625772.1 nuclear transport factor 2 family protein [Saccharopolyspora oryzae]
MARRTAVSALWAEDGVEVIESAQHRGRDEIEARITAAHDEFVRGAGFVFRSAGDATGHHDTITFTTHMVPAGGGDIAWTGRAFVVLGPDGLIRSDHQFTVPTGDTRSTVEDFLRRLAEGDPDRIAEVFAEQVDWVLDWPAEGHPAVPWIRPRSTRADVADHFRTIAEFHVPGEAAGSAARILVEGNEAVVLGDIRQTAKATGKAYTALCALHLVVEDGLITRYAVYEDSLTVAEALSCS